MCKIYLEPVAFVRPIILATVTDHLDAFDQIHHSIIARQIRAQMAAHALMLVCLVFAALVRLDLRFRIALERSMSARRIHVETVALVFQPLVIIDIDVNVQREEQVGIAN